MTCGIKGCSGVKAGEVTVRVGLADHDDLVHIEHKPTTTAGITVQSIVLSPLNRIAKAFEVKLDVCQPHLDQLSGPIHVGDYSIGGQ